MTRPIVTWLAALALVAITALGGCLREEHGASSAKGWPSCSAPVVACGPAAGPERVPAREGVDAPAPPLPVPPGFATARPDVDACSRTALRRSDGYHPHERGRLYMRDCALLL